MFCLLSDDSRWHLTGLIPAVWLSLQLCWCTCVCVDASRCRLCRGGEAADIVCDLLHLSGFIRVLSFLPQVVLMGLAEGYRVNGGPLGEGADRAFFVSSVACISMLYVVVHALLFSSTLRTCHDA